MRTWKDQVFKELVETVLWKAGRVSTQHEIAPPDAQWADVWFEPDPEHREERLKLGWLGKLCELACMFESFSAPPSEGEVRECLRKLFTKQHRQDLDASKKGQVVAVPAMLWLVSERLGDAHQRAFRMSRRRNHPQGIWVGPPGICMGWISLRELPERRDTLLLRLMGVGTEVFRRAMNEALALPDGAVEKQVALEILVAHWKKVGNNQTSAPDEANVDEEEVEWMMSYHEIYEQWKQELWQKGMREGELKGMREGELKGAREGLQKGVHQGELQGIRETILAIYRGRFGAPPSAVLHRVNMENDRETLLSWCGLFVSGTQDEIALHLNASSQ